MARFSKTAQGMKLEDGDIVMVQGVKGKVASVTLLRSTIGTGVLVEVDFSHGTDATNMLNLSDIEAVRHEGAWVNLKGEEVAA